MKSSRLLLVLSVASLASGVAFSQTPAQTKPYTESKPATSNSTMSAQAGGSYNLAQLDKNKDGFVDKQEAKASPSLEAIFDRADTNKDGKLDAAELNAASSMPRTN